MELALLHVSNAQGLAQHNMVIINGHSLIIKSAFNHDKITIESP